MPTLHKMPLHLPPLVEVASGLGGKTCIIDVGGPDFLKPMPQKDKVYDYASLCELIEHPDSFILGAGAGPHHKVGVNCELICNLRLGENAENKTKVAKVVEQDGSYVLEDDKSGEFAVLGNFFICQGNSGQVLEIKAENRTGPLDFVACVHKTLTAHYGSQAVGVGGTFLLKTGKANIHVMPDFSKTPLITSEESDNWLKFYEMDAPLVHVGEIVSADPQQLHLRQEHFHCFSNHGQGGHYHYDTTPIDASYLGYLNLAEMVYRIDLPQNRKFLF